MNRSNDTTLYQLLRYDSTNWQNEILLINTFDSLGNLTVQLQQSWINGAWQTQLRKLYGYDAEHNDTAYIDQQPDSSGVWFNVSKYNATYDSFNNITMSRMLAWDTSGTWVPHDGYQMNRYYYQAYTLPTGVATVTPAVDARIYPVPASHMLSIDIQWPEAQDATMTIYDMTGRSYSTQHTGCTASYHGYMPVSLLPDGMYTMRIAGTSGSISRTFSVRK